MARPYGSVDSPLLRQEAFSQFGGTPTRQTTPQNPKDGTSQDAQQQFMMALLSNPAMGPLLQFMLQNPEKVEQFAFAKPKAQMTQLSPIQQKAFLHWLSSIGRGPGSGFEDYTKPGADYDMPGYWLNVASKGMNRTGINPADQRLHFPDTYKLPNEPGFSSESIYAAPNSPFHWYGETLIDTRTGQPVSGQPLGTIPMYGGGDQYHALIAHLLSGAQ